MSIQFDDRGAADPSNLPPDRFWNVNSSFGPGFKFYSAADLKKAVSEYFRWAEDNPLYERKVFSSADGIRNVNAPKKRVFTITGLCLFIGVARRTWEEWRAARKGAATIEGLRDVVLWADDVIYTQKFEGATVNLFVPTFIERDLGLADKREISGPNGGPIQVEDVTEEQLVEEARRLGVDPEVLGLLGGDDE